MLLKEQMVTDPFERWSLDFMGLINPPSHQKYHILVYTNYVTKWVESKALTKATKQVVSDFLFEYIFVRFLVPREIVIDGRSHFTSHLIEKLTKRYSI
jgi:hypothetical protein